MKIKINQPIRIERCPYLGLHDDGSTALAYASEWNYCYHATPPASLRLSQQAEVCLCPQYGDCAILLSDKWGRLPRGLRGRRGARLRGNSPSSRFLWFTLGILLVVILTVLLYQRYFF